MVKIHSTKRGSQRKAETRGLKVQPQASESPKLTEWTPGLANVKVKAKDDIHLLKGPHDYIRFHIETSAKCSQFQGSSLFYPLPLDGGGLGWG